VHAQRRSAAFDESHCETTNRVRVEAAAATPRIREGNCLGPLRETEGRTEERNGKRLELEEGRMVPTGSIGTMGIAICALRCFFLAAKNRRTPGLQRPREEKGEYGPRHK